ncbi:hypothetical protein [Saccharopolyspora sp. NPDC050642]
MTTHDAEAQAFRAQDEKAHRFRYRFSARPLNAFGTECGVRHVIGEAGGE